MRWAPGFSFYLDDIIDQDKEYGVTEMRLLFSVL